MPAHRAVSSAAAVTVASRFPCMQQVDRSGVAECRNAASAAFMRTGAGGGGDDAVLPVRREQDDRTVGAEQRLAISRSATGSVASARLQLISRLVIADAGDEPRRNAGAPEHHCLVGAFAAEAGRAGNCQQRLPGARQGGDSEEFHRA